MSDKPTNVVSLKGLDLEVKESEPFRVPVPGGKGFIEFPDFTRGDAEEVERRFQLFHEGSASGVFTPFLKEWLPAEEYKKFREAYPEYNQQALVIGRVMETIGEKLGSSGEGNA